MSDRAAPGGAGPLSGLRVVELAGIGPAPHGCMVLADLGADVVRVERLAADRLLTELDTDPRRSAVFSGLRRLLAVRREHPVFSPFAGQRVLDVDDRVLALVRGEEGVDPLVCVTNVTAATVPLPGVSGTDVLTGQDGPVTLGPYGFAWIRPDRP